MENTYPIPHSEEVVVDLPLREAMNVLMIGGRPTIKQELPGYAKGCVHPGIFVVFPFQGEHHPAFRRRTRLSTLAPLLTETFVPMRLLAVRRPPPLRTHLGLSLVCGSPQWRFLAGVSVVALPDDWTTNWAPDLERRENG